MDFWRPRSIDTLRFTILRRVFLVLAALLCYAVNLGIRVSKREYANQSKTMYLGHDAIEVEDVPDLIFCTTNATRIRGSLPKGYCRSVNSLKTPTISPGYYLHSPCDENHDTMFIFWTDQGKIKLNGIDGLVKVFEFESNDTEDIKFVLLPSEDDTYRALKVLPLAVKQNHPMIYNELFNVHYARPNQTIAYMSYNVQITRSLRSDFWGLFNTRNQKLDKNVETHVEEYIYSPGETRFHLKIPYSWKESKQVLLLSIPDALAAWGGDTRQLASSKRGS
ncbi:hypothetical protein BGX31_009983 [Mortierella sp. GBA43]|nr:hypothetical protein BGX31_009983 [Mortierella sp. GBA43]